MRPIDADQILSAANSEEKLIGKDWDYDALKTSIELAPTLDVEPVIYAEWIENNRLYHCSHCNAIRPHYWVVDSIAYDECRRCYMCGAKMKNGDSEYK